MPSFKKYKIPLLWLRRHISARDFMLVSSVLVGFTAGLAAVVLKSLVHYIQLLLAYGNRLLDQPYWLVIFPILGILLTVLVVQSLFRGSIGRGTANVLFSISQKSSLVERHKVYSHMLTSALTVGFGGSAGLESPIVVTGSAIGSNYGRDYHLNYRDRTLLLSCGAAAGIAAVFNAPIAGVLFAIEVLLSDISIAAFIPLIISAVTGALCSRIILDEEILFNIAKHDFFATGHVPFYILLGILSGMLSVFYTRVSLRVEAVFEIYQHRVYTRALVGSLLLGLLIMLFPPLFGEGYDSVLLLERNQADRLLQDSWLAFFGTNEWLVLGFVGAMALVKAFATSFTIAAGGNGGNFAPSMFVGACAGYFFSRLMNLLHISDLSVSSFSMVGMAGILSGVMHAPLTAVFLIAEITGGYTLMIPLMIVSAVSFALVKYFEPYSLDTKKLAQKGQFLKGNKDSTILHIMKIRHLIEHEFQTVSPDATLGELVQLIAHSRRNVFPVVNAEKVLEGVVYLENVREIMFKAEKYDTVRVHDLMVQPPAVVQYDDSMAEVMKKFDESGAWNLPVLRQEKYVGFVSKSSIFTKYRKLLIKTTNM
ncbi:chloride channel protein [Pontibacter russatus]|uniref:chloride channel protein n=1 Tax=Pontibacter russatus TaxID=2694929 RepID=UPI00137A28D3|nr:chloride channel protein [Pontibacter russatus]